MTVCVRRELAVVRKIWYHLEQSSEPGAIPFAVHVVHGNPVVWYVFDGVEVIVLEALVHDSDDGDGQLASM